MTKAPRKNGTRFPNGVPSGNRVPEYSLRVGRRFRLRPLALDIDLRPLPQGVDRLIHVEQISHDADNKEHRQVTKAEDFTANQDGREQCIGGAAKDGCVAQRGAKRDGHAELSLVMATSG